MALKDILWLQFIVLLGGVVFSWYQWIKVFKQSKICSSCADYPHPDPNCHACFNPEKPFRSKCFFGAIFFTLAFFLNFWLLYELNSMIV